MIKITAEVQAYFNGQRDTKYMNESTAEFAQMRILRDPQTCLPANWHEMLMLYFWNMFEKNPIDRYTSPYWLGRFLLQKLDKELCPVTGYSEAPAPVFRKVDNPLKPKARLKAIANREPKDPEKMPHPDFSRHMTDEDGNLLEFTGLWRLVEVPDSDLTPILEIIRKYVDLTFFFTYLDFEKFEQVHAESMAWIEDRFIQISDTLKRGGWHADLLAQPMPPSLDAKLEKVQQWLGVLQHQREEPGPQFPAHEQELTWMGQILSMIKA